MEKTEIVVCPECTKGLSKLQTETLYDLACICANTDVICLRCDDVQKPLAKIFAALEKRGFLVTNEAPALHMLFTSLWTDDESFIVCACKDIKEFSAQDDLDSR